MNNFEIQFDRYSQTFQENDIIEGVVNFCFSSLIDLAKESAANNFYLQLKGKIIIKNDLNNKELNEITKTIENTVLINIEQKLDLEGKNVQRSNNLLKVPFEIKLERKKSEKQLIETYYGIFIQSFYFLKLIKHISKQEKQVLGKEQIYIQKRSNEEVREESQVIKINREILQHMNSKYLKRVSSDTDIEIVIRQNVINIDESLEGYFQINNFNLVISSVDIQLQRIESITYKFQQVSEIQLFQIAHGNLQRNIPIPFQMIFPKNFTCPNFQFNKFQVDFQITFIVVTKESIKLQRTFPIVLIRKY